MSKFYTHIAKFGNNMLVREIVDGIPSIRKDKWKPTVYLIDSNAIDSKFVSLYGDKVKAVQVGDMNETRDWIKQYSDVSDFQIFGQLNEVLQYTNEYDLHDPRFDQLSILSLDIETSGAPETPKYSDDTLVTVKLK